MSAICKCANGHVFSSPIIDNEPDVNLLTVEDEWCPECGTPEFEVTDVEYDDFDYQ